MRKIKLRKSGLASLALLVLISAMGLTLTSCGKKLERDITFYNETPYPIEQILLATEKTRANDDKKLCLLDYGEETIAAGGVSALIFSVPEKELNESWYLQVHGGDEENTFGTEEELGTIFLENIDSVEIYFDEIEQKFTYVILYE